MTPVYQTIFSTVNGNCMQASYASLLDMPLDEVPNFAEPDDWFAAIEQFMRHQAHLYQGYLINPKYRGHDEANKATFQAFQESLPENGSIEGYYDGTVISPGYFDEERYRNDPTYIPVLHCVVIDRHFNIVHDPNPAYKDVKKYPLADEIGHNGVVASVLWRKPKVS